MCKITLIVVLLTSFLSHAQSPAIGVMAGGGTSFYYNKEYWKQGDNLSITLKPSYSAEVFWEVKIHKTNNFIRIAGEGIFFKQKYHGVIKDTVCSSSTNCIATQNSYNVILQSSRFFFKPSFGHQKEYTNGTRFSLYGGPMLDILVNAFQNADTTTITTPVSRSSLNKHLNPAVLGIHLGTEYDIAYEWGRLGIGVRGILSLGNIERKNEGISENWRFPVGFLVIDKYAYTSEYWSRPKTRLFSIVVSLKYQFEYK